MTDAERKQLYDLIDEYWGDYDKHRNDDFIVNPSIPIIWFGNIDAYLAASPAKRIVTLAINPSNHEFLTEELPAYSSEYRFRIGRDIADLKFLRSNKERDLLINAYNQYFNHNPYSDFFGAFERVLQNLPGCEKASYGDPGHKPEKLYGVKNNKGDYHTHKYTAIHIDCKTAIATKQLWDDKEKKIENKERYNDFQEIKKSLSETGETPFNHLLAFLNPKIILVSSAWFRDNELVDKGTKLRWHDFGKKMNNKDKNDRISYEMNGRLWIYGRFYPGCPFQIPKGKNDEEKQFFQETFDKFGITL